MKHTKENVIRLLDEMAAFEMEVANIYKNGGDHEAYRRRVTEATAYHTAISLLKNKKFFDTMCETHPFEN